MWEWGRGVPAVGLRTHACAPRHGTDNHLPTFLHHKKLPELRVRIFVWCLLLHGLLRSGEVAVLPSPVHSSGASSALTAPPRPPPGPCTPTPAAPAAAPPPHRVSMKLTTWASHAGTFVRVSGSSSCERPISLFFKIQAPASHRDRTAERRPCRVQIGTASSSGEEQSRLMPESGPPHRTEAPRERATHLP